MTPDERQVEREIWIALERLVTRMENFFAWRQAAQKYRADQARWPAGSPGSIGGQFAPENGGTAHGNYLRTGRRPVQLAFAGDDTQLAQVGGGGSSGGRGGGPRPPRGGPPEESEFLAPLRTTLYFRRLDQLRLVEPDNPHIAYLSNIQSTPSIEALNRLTDELHGAVVRRITDFVTPGGVPIGRRGSNSRIREVPGELKSAQEAFDYLRVGGTVVHNTDYVGTLVRLPGGVGFVGLRPVSSSGSPAVDIEVPEISYKRLHYPSVWP
ncbi:MAG: hypothetical protein HY246_00120 [Proteobacteria bacterium]|nr:hypothetical protein [Pseudomonadota bacterium]